MKFSLSQNNKIYSTVLWKALFLWVSFFIDGRKSRHSFQIRSHDIILILRNSYRKSTFRGSLNSLIGPSMKTTKIGTPWKLCLSHYCKHLPKTPLMDRWGTSEGRPLVNASPGSCWLRTAARCCIVCVRVHSPRHGLSGAETSMWIHVRTYSMGSVMLVRWPRSM